MNLTARIAATFNRPGAGRDDVVGAAAVPAASRGSRGSGAPSSRRLRAALAVLALVVAGFSVAAVPALAAPPSTTTPEVLSTSYTSAELKGKVTTDGSGFLGNTSWAFEYSTDGVNWNVGFQSNFETNLHGKVTDAPVHAPITGLKGGTKYFVRLSANNGFAGSETPTTSPEPNPSFTTLTADPPSVEQADDASEVEYTQVKVTGHVDRPTKSNDLTCNFEYITDTTWQANPAGERFTGATPVPCDAPNPISAVGSSKVEAKLTGLTASTTYHLRLVVSNAAAEDAKEAPDTFTTAGPVPVPSVERIDDATEVEFSRATIKGEVSRPAGADPILNTVCAFEYITDAAYAANPVGERFAGATPIGCEPAALIEAGGPSPAEAHLTGLAPSTTYHLRLVATDSGGSASEESADTFATEGPVIKPTILEVGEATEVGKRTAQVSGRVERPAGKDPAFDVECTFEYVTDAQFLANPPGEEFAGAGQVGCAPENPITSPEPGHPAVTAAVSAELGGLEPGTTYHLRLAGKNAGGTVTEEAPSTFTTVAVVPPTLTADSVAEVGYTGFKVTGTADPGNQGIFPFFEYAPVGTEEWTGNPIGRFVEIPAGSPAQQESFTFPCGAGGGGFCDGGPIKPGTTYKVRLSGRESEGFTTISSTEPYPEFTTKGTSTPPSTTLQVTDVAGTTAHISAVVDTHAPAETLDAEGRAAYQTDWHFECTPGCPPGLSSGSVSAAEGSQSIEVDAKNLEAKKHYEIMLVAHDSLATVESEQSFDTLAVAPTVTALPGGSDGEGGYTLAGIVNPNNSPVTACEFRWGPDSNYAFKADCSPPPGEKGKPVTVEAHLTGLNPGVVYHADLFATNGAGTEKSKDFKFTPTLAVKGPECPNEQLRRENNSTALPECRAYEMVSDPNKEGNSANFLDNNGGDAVAYESGAPNIAGSGQATLTGANRYVATRTADGWQTIANLNGPTGSLSAAPEYVVPGEGVWSALVYSSDLRSSVWQLRKEDNPEGIYLRRPDGRFELVAPGNTLTVAGVGIGGDLIQVSDDLSHLVLSSPNGFALPWGPGVYEFVGTGNDQPRRVDVDNAGQPIPGCTITENVGAKGRGGSVSADGRVIVLGACDGSILARVDGTTSYDLSGSFCNRPDCDPPAPANFQASSKDGSRTYFTTTQQLVDGDTDESNDLYACDIPITPQAPVGTTNPCSALHQVSGGDAGDARVQKVLSVSDDGSTAYFTARGVLADNEDALDEEALSGDENLYVWRTDAAHPAGQTTFVARLPENNPGVAQTTSDGRYLVLQTAGRLLPSDTDGSSDIYRYDADAGELVRVSTAFSGAGGNGEFDARLGSVGNLKSPPHDSHPSISDNGKLIVFATEEALSPADGDGEPDAYLWNDGHALGSVAPLAPGKDISGGKSPGQVTIDGSGQDIYVQTAERLTPSDADFGADVYDLRIGGGFPQSQQRCSGETCQPGAIDAPSGRAPSSEQPGSGNPPQPRPCPKGKVNRHHKCVKKHKQKHKPRHHKKKSHHKHDGTNPGHKGGGGK